jgi:hypothetical protein
VRLDERHRRSDASEQLVGGRGLDSRRAVSISRDAWLQLAQPLDERMTFEQRRRSGVEELPPLLVDGLRCCEVFGEQLLNEARVQVIKPFWTHRDEDTDALARFRAAREAELANAPSRSNLPQVRGLMPRLRAGGYVAQPHALSTAHC